MSAVRVSWREAVAKLSTAQLLLGMLAVGQGAALVYAGAVLDGHTEGLYLILSIVRAVPGGIGASFAAAYATHNIVRSGGKKAVRVGWIAIGMLVGASIVVTAICTVEPPTGLLRWVASCAYAVMVDAAVVAVAVTSGKLFSEPPSETTPKTTAKQPEQPNAQEEQPAPGRIDPVVLESKVAHNPKITNAQLAQLFGVSPQAVQKHRSKK